MKIYFGGKPHHGRAMMRVQKAIEKFAPDDITFTDNVNEADIQFLHMIGTGELTDLRKDKFVLFPYCFESMSQSALETAQRVFNESLMVFSYLDVPDIIKSNNFNFLSSPLGVNTSVFKKSIPEYRDVSITTTGYVSGSEGIQPCVIASSNLGKFSIHVGGNLTSEIGYDMNKKYNGLYHRKENITEEELIICYNRSNYVSGLRRFEGFELPVLEGALCGARPICFDIECYRRWFGDLPVYISECDEPELVEKLTEVFSTINPVSDEEIDWVKKTFSWEVIASNFWKKFKETI